MISDGSERTIGIFSSIDQEINWQMSFDDIWKSKGKERFSLELNNNLTEGTHKIIRLNRNYINNSNDTLIT